MRTAIYTVFIVCGFVAPAAAQQAPPATIPVGVVKAEHKSIEKTLDFVGRVEAVNRVEIRARVQGFLEAVLFKEGDPIKEGDPLYHIEKGLFQAAVEQAEGALTRSKAAKVPPRRNSGGLRTCWQRTRARPLRGIKRLLQTSRQKAKSSATTPTSRPPKSILAIPKSRRRFPGGSAAPISPRAMLSARTAARSPSS
jgi:multidrug efflux pump subunit AcrA (membrane-fusion protein)